MRKLKKIPKFKSKAEEAQFWATHDSTDYVDYSEAKRIVFPNLKPSTKTISIRLPESLIEHLKVLANKRDVPYQSLLKIFLSEKVAEELHGTAK
ncbi:MAG TPA: BrnA antitoxin family protein [Thermodesulfovibrionales bacterium]|jgi:predicted DNA binding CopG/RHH family protein|nr:BrnA antitoxin family protein [Thermodesulfovibrionales bacterium]